MTRLSRINIVFPSALESSSTIDGEYYSRIVFQSLTADTKTGTFVWMLDEFKAARGAAPDMFLQDADAAMTQAADRVFPDAKKRRCMWHLGKNLLTNLRGLLGGHFNALLDQFYKTCGRLTKNGFEAEYAKLVETFPKSRPYMDTLYADRDHWAVYSSVLAFSVASFTTNRVESMNARAKRYFDSSASLVRVFNFLSGTLEKHRDRATLRDAQLRLPMVTAPDTTAFWFGAPVTTPLKFALGVWPYKFMMDEVALCAMFCSSPSNAVLEGPARAEALSRFEYIGMMVVDVETVALIVENHNGTDKQYVVLGMKDGGHLCSCCTLQELGLCCRHFWAAMRLSRKDKFHVGILNQHWLADQGRKLTSEWPEGAKPMWAVAKNYTPLTEDEVQAPLVSTGGDGVRLKWNADNTTIEPSLVKLKETGPIPQDRRYLYVDCLKEATAAVGLGVEIVPPDARGKHGGEDRVEGGDFGGKSECSPSSVEQRLWEKKKGVSQATFRNRGGVASVPPNILYLNRRAMLWSCLFLFGASYLYALKPPVGQGSASVVMYGRATWWRSTLVVVFGFGPGVLLSTCLF